MFDFNQQVQCLNHWKRWWLNGDGYPCLHRIATKSPEPSGIGYGNLKYPVIKEAELTAYSTNSLLALILET